MEPTDLTCPACGTAWKVIKAPDGPLTCPNCKMVVGQATPNGPIPEPVPPAPMTPAADPMPSRAADVSDIDDPGLAGPARGRVPDTAPPVRGRNPLLTVGVVLLLLLLVPVALISCLIAVCALSVG